jgi:hypothetical protein
MASGSVCVCGRNLRQLATNGRRGVGGRRGTAPQMTFSGVEFADVLVRTTGQPRAARKGENSAELGWRGRDSTVKKGQWRREVCVWCEWCQRGDEADLS